MFKENIKVEIQILKRNKTLPLFSIIMLVLILFATYNGQKKVEMRVGDITTLEQEIVDYDRNLVKKLESVKNGEKIAKPWEITASYVSYRRGALTSIPAKDFSFIAIGQSDMYTNQKKVSSYGNDFAADLTELSNPTQLFFGNFDISFVIVYLLPLLVIAFSYNIVSSERERGSLSLVLSQPIKALNWLYQKILIRLIILSLIVFVSISLSFLLFNKLSLSTDFWLIFLISFLYLLFWFSLSLFINLSRYNSSINAFLLLSLWILIIFIVPSIINNYSSQLYPVPSRTILINEMRAKQAELNKIKDETLKEYLKDHPELISEEKEKKYGFYEKYFASKKKLKEELSPLLNQYQNQIKERDKLIEKLSLISPAILLQNTFQEIAGTSAEHYHDYRDQYLNFSEQWLNFFVPYLFEKKTFDTGTINVFPKFQYSQYMSSNSLTYFLTATLIFVTITLLSQVNRITRNKLESSLLTIKS